MKTSVALLGIVASFSMGLLVQAARIAGTPIVDSPPGHPLVWDAMMKSNYVEFGKTNTQFIFFVTNSAATNVTITNVMPGCGCTAPKLPSTPWVLKPKDSGPVSANIDLMGKFGEMSKNMRVISSAGEQTLTMKVTIPETAETIRRMQGMMQAKSDPQSVFKGECAACHVQKGEGKMGAELFAADCGICHEAEHRAELVPDLAKLNRPTPPEYWRMTVSGGKPGTLMPAFGKKFGGPLSNEQIDSLVTYLEKKYPSIPSTTPAPAK
jgi:mono/diheme cytochrome c family protein